MRYLLTAVVLSLFFLVGFANAQEDDGAELNRLRNEVAILKSECDAKDKRIAALQSELLAARLEIERLKEKCNEKSDDDSPDFKKLYKEYAEKYVFADGRFFRLPVPIKGDGSRGSLPKKYDEIFQTYSPSICRCYKLAKEQYDMWRKRSPDRQVTRKEITEQTKKWHKRCDEIGKAIVSAAKDLKDTYETGLPKLALGEYGMVNGYRVHRIVGKASMMVTFVKVPSIKDTIPDFSADYLDHNYETLKERRFEYNTNPRPPEVGHFAIIVYLLGFDTSALANNVEVKQDSGIAIVGTLTEYGQTYLVGVPLEKAQSGLSKVEFKLLLDSGIDPEKDDTKTDAD